MQPWSAAARGVQCSNVRKSVLALRDWLSSVLAHHTAMCWCVCPIGICAGQPPSRAGSHAALLPAGVLGAATTDAISSASGAVK
jgi:hypothetical protein